MASTFAVLSGLAISTSLLQRDRSLVLLEPTYTCQAWTSLRSPPARSDSVQATGTVAPPCGRRNRLRDANGRTD